MNLIRHDVSDFTAHELVYSKGHIISSSELYTRYREWYTKMNATPCDISDVKLAEVFGKHLSNKRISSGRVWLDHKLCNNEWSGPKTFEDYEVYISLDAGETVIHTSFFAKAFKDLTIHAPDESQMSLLVHNDAFDVIKNNEPILPGLLLINVMYMEISIRIVVDKTCIIRCTVTKCTDHVPSDVKYTNSTVLTSGLSAELISKTIIFTTNAGKSNMYITPCFKTHELVLQDIASVDTTEFCSTELYVKTWKGLLYPAVCESMLHKLLVASGSSFVQSDDVSRSRDTYIPYIEHDSNGYRYCLQINLSHDCDIIHNFKLTGLPIPENMFQVTLNTQSYDNKYIILCSDRARCLELKLTYKTTYYVPKLPTLHILHGCKLTASMMMCDRPIRYYLYSQPYIATTLEEIFPSRSSIDT